MSGLLFSVRFVSPMVSFAMGGYLLSIYANLQETDLTADHPRWIGAWWLGFLICSIVNFIICIPTSMIPRKLRPIRSKVKTDVAEEEEKEEVEKKEEKNETEEKEEDKWESTEKKEGKEDDQSDDRKEEEEEEDENGERMEEEGREVKKSVDDMKTPFVASTSASQQSSSRPAGHESGWKELPKATMRLLTNPIYVLASIAICIDCFIVGFMAFLPKYFEVYFQKTASVANLLGGMIPAIFGGCASYVGGLVSGKIKGIDGGVAGLCRMNSTLSLICLLCLVPAMFLSCPDIPYSGHLVNDRLNLSTTCNIDCVCSSDVFDPVCGSDGLLYFSPCHAGCTRLFNSTVVDSNDLSGRQVRATDCGCVAEAESRDEEEEEQSRSFVFAGFCGYSCASMIPYVLNLVVIFFSLNMYNVPCTTIILRCIREEDKSFALGLQTFGICLTTPLLYGSVFDAACVLKETKSCTDSEGSCLLYDRQALRFAFHGLTIGLHALATILYYVTYFLARHKLTLLTAQHKTQLTELMELKANRSILAQNPNGADII